MPISCGIGTLAPRLLSHSLIINIYSYIIKIHITTLIVYLNRFCFLDCGQNYTIKNGYVHFKGDKTTYNHQFPVSCLEGYSVIGDKNTTCLASGTWSKHSACKPTGLFSFQVNLALLNSGLLCICKRCRSRSAGS